MGLIPDAGGAAAAVTAGPPRPVSRRVLLRAGLAAALVGPARAATAPARPVEDFLDSVGINVHLGSEPYASRFPEMTDLLVRSGIRHLRDELRPSNDLARWKHLHAAHGIRANLLVSPATNTVPEMLAYLEAVGPETVSAIEGQNEGDSDWFMAQPVARPHWAEAVVAYQRAIYQALRARYHREALPILSPSVLDYKPEDVALIEGAAAFCDAVAVHSYVQHGQEPETADPYAGIDWYLARMRDAFKPGAPAFCTEVGYCNFVRPGGSGVSEAAAGTYIPRLLMNNFAAGVQRSFLYQLMDGGTSTENSEDHWGLVRIDGTPKPAFTALARLLGALREPAGDPSPEPPVAVTLPEASADLRHVALSRRDGSLMVVLWRAVSCWDPDRAVEIEAPARPQRVVASRPPRGCRSLAVNAAGSWTNQAAGGRELVLPVGSALTILWLS